MARDSIQYYLALDLVLKLNAQGTSEAKASTPEPVGPKPLWHKKSPEWHLPYY